METPCPHCRRLDRALRASQAQNRHLVDELNWAEEQVRVLRRLVERLAARLPPKEGT